MTTHGSPHIGLTPERVRRLSIEDLDLTHPVPGHLPSVEAVEQLEEDDPILVTARDLLSTYGGLIFVGPPGTSKSWYAARLAVTLAEGDASLVRFVQFHPSYQYEDFVEGFIPVESGGFKMVPKHLLELCDLADKNPDRSAVLVIDELSRGDPGRIFGEALTYIEKSKRGLPFSLASGTTLRIPTNLVVLATMNALDRGVDDVDAAFDRRFAKIPLDPNAEILTQFLNQAGMRDDLKSRVLEFFRLVNDGGRANPYSALGQTHFIGVSDEDDLRRVWEHQLRFHFDKAYRLDAEGRGDIDRAWDRVLAVGMGAVLPADDEVPDTGGADELPAAADEEDAP